ncbi:MAG TPA: AAA family ATPase, partial [Vampirovibrionales bacterium]
MKFNYIVINNFLSFAPVDQRYDFPERGLIGIIGTKDTDGDSNGSGKSSFLEAIVYALTGKTVKGYKVSEITNSNHRTIPHSVIISLTKGTGEEYVIERGSTNFKLSRISDGKEVIETKQTKDLTQKFIYDEILNIKFETITSSLACSADQDIPILKLTNSFKKGVVENLVLGNEIEKLYEKSKNRRANIQDDVDRIQKQFDEIETTVKSKISSLKAYKEDKDNKKRALGDEIEELNNIDVEKGQAIIKCKSLKKEKEDLEKGDGEELKKKEESLEELKKLDIDKISKQLDIRD